jgi:hypothetical protein
MNTVANTDKTEWLRLPIAASAFAAAALGLSIFFGSDSAKGCLWAILVSGVAGCGGLVPVIYALIYRPALLAILVLAAGMIRLLLMAVGTAILILLVNVNVLWFLIWLGLFYAAILVSEVWWAVRRFRKHTEIRGRKI